MFSLVFALLSSASAFHLLTVHSGSQFQYYEVKLSSDGHWSLNGESDLNFTLDKGSLRGNGRSNDIIEGFPIVNDHTWASDIWKVESHDLTWDNSGVWYVCPDNNNNIAFGAYGAPSTCTNAVQVVLYTPDVANA